MELFTFRGQLLNVEKVTQGAFVVRLYLKDLLQQGAGLVTSAMDVIEALGLLGVSLTGLEKERAAQKSEDDPDLTPPMRELLESIPFEPTQIDDIIGSGRSDLVISILTELELQGRVARCEGGAYCRLK